MFAEEETFTRVRDERMDYLDRYRRSHSGEAEPSAPYIAPMLDRDTLTGAAWINRNDPAHRLVTVPNPRTMRQVLLDHTRKRDPKLTGPRTGLQERREPAPIILPGTQPFQGDTAIPRTPRSARHQQAFQKRFVPVQNGGTVRSYQPRFA
jgi:hypothetical protein